MLILTPAKKAQMAVREIREAIGREGNAAKRGELAREARKEREKYGRLLQQR